MLVQVIASVSAIAITLGVLGGGLSWLGHRVARSVARSMQAIAKHEMAEATAKITKRIDDSDDLTAKQLAEIKATAETDRLEMARQFGGNGGGMREAINGLSSQMQHLAGRFEQHLAESGNR